MEKRSRKEGRTEGERNGRIVKGGIFLGIKMKNVGVGPFIYGTKLSKVRFFFCVWIGIL